MGWLTLEEMNSKIMDLTEAVYQVIHKENFILSPIDIRSIKIGRDNYEYGKSISSKALLEVIDNVR